MDEHAAAVHASKSTLAYFDFAYFDFEYFDFGYISLPLGDACPATGAGSRGVEEQATDQRADGMEDPPGRVNPPLEWDIGGPGEDSAARKGLKKGTAG